MKAPDFRTSQFIVCNENPFRLTPPSAQASFRAQVKGDHTTNTPPKDQPSTQQNYPDPSFSDIFTAFKEAFNQRKAQGLAFLELTNSELMLIKKSFFVTIFACLAAFAVGTVCWLILNIAIGALLHSMGLHYVAVPLILLVLNSIAAFGFFKLAQNAFNYLSFSRLIQTWRKVFE
ncbi:hypothetical protein RJ41_02175 [Alteromonas marina]|jgi:hypothetical protein|uniref:Uncharacterized protein n=1 Tax=Alteromonas marina TaxID=203795 RepID=A0A0B3YHY3_9ALTE|nr:hypothetical protein [Alteromonas marina]KHT57464.1 hypothetical protein RJ41_02175 [Alteromonas marina]MCH2191567.1 hypothetical protein [Gammaproteobacteria bacterium]|tara:strand:+ start:212 stop:736 length:525 start_codon:yes stop_codon:yes gene_type:complete